MAYCRAMEMEYPLDQLRALADPTRLGIIRFLASECCRYGTVDEDGSLVAGPSAGEVCCHLTGIERVTSTVSHHLHELEAAGLITLQRQGKRMICSLRNDALLSLSTELRALTAGSCQ